MKSHYASKDAAKADLKPLLKRLGKGWRLLTRKDEPSGGVRPALVFRETLEVRPDGDNKYQALLKGSLIAHGKSVEAAAQTVVKFFHHRLPSLHRYIDENHAACDALVDRAPSPLRDALRVICGAEPPSFVRGYHSNDYTDEENEQLQDWCSMHARPHWATGIGIIEAAELLVSEAVANANIPGEGK